MEQLWRDDKKEKLSKTDTKTKVGRRLIWAAIILAGSSVVFIRGGAFLFVNGIAVGAVGLIALLKPPKVGHRPHWFSTIFLILAVIMWAYMSSESWRSQIAYSPWLYVSAICIFLFGVLALYFEPWQTPDPVTRERLRGARLSDRDKFLALFLARHPKPFTPAVLATLPMPEGAERLHTLISASTGAGKSQTLLHLMKSIRERGERAVIFDNNGEFRRRFAQGSDIVIDPFSGEGPGWRLANEAKSAVDWERLAGAFIGEGTGNSKEWLSMAKAMFSAAGRSLWEMYGRELSNAELQRVLVSASPRELAPVVAGTSVEVLATDDDRAASRLQSVRMSFIDNLKSWQYLKDGDFSFRDWMTQGPDGEWLFVPYKDFNLPIARVLISAWADILISAALESGGARSDKTTWVIIDELDSLGEITALLGGVARLRKAGVAIVAVVQDHSQLRATYGQDRAATLLNNLSTKVILRTTDAEAAEKLSAGLGDMEMMQTSRGTSTSANGDGSSTSHAIVTSRLVMASEIQSLPDLAGYVKFAGDWPAVSVKVPIFGKDD